VRGDPVRVQRLRPARDAGYSFLELLIVMGLLAVLVGVGIGFIANVGRSGRTAQAAGIVVEAGARCQNLSAGTRRATLEIRKSVGADGVERVLVVTGVQRPVLTANFEAARKGQPGTEWLISAGGSPDAAKPNGDVKVTDDGHTGRGASFSKNGWLDFGRRAAFAVTHGLEVDVQVKPDAGRNRMTLLRADDGNDVLWQVALVKNLSTSGEAYQVEVSLRTVPERAENATANLERVTTKEPAVAPGQWSHLRVTHDGRTVTVTVNGVARPLDLPPPPKGAPPPEARRFVLPPSGVSHLSAGHPQAAYSGSMDSLQVSGIFRTDDDVRELGNVVVLARTLPIVLHFSNGRLDPTFHAQDEAIRLQSLSEEGSGVHWRVRFGLYGALTPPERVVEALP
jgi:concanavalin A-like lectin/glucanase superfamily protein